MILIRTPTNQWDLIENSGTLIEVLVPEKLFYD
jgi:hypothetical protein